MMNNLNGGISRSRTGVTEPEPRLDFTDLPLSLLIIKMLIMIFEMIIMIIKMIIMIIKMIIIEMIINK